MTDQYPPPPPPPPLFRSPQIGKKKKRKEWRRQEKKKREKISPGIKTESPWMEEEEKIPPPLFSRPLSAPATQGSSSSSSSFSMTLPCQDDDPPEVADAFKNGGSEFNHSEKPKPKKAFLSPLQKNNHTVCPLIVSLGHFSIGEIIFLLVLPTFA